MAVPQTTLPPGRQPSAGGRLRGWRTLVTAAMVGALLAGCGQGVTQSNLSSGRPGKGINPNDAPETSTAFRIGNGAWQSSIAYNPFGPDAVGFWNLSLLGLAVVFDRNRPGPNSYYPELAKSWTVGKHTITFHLRPHARWQDGTAFTSRDVVTSLLLSGADLNSVWAEISSIRAPDAHTVVVGLQPWAVPRNVLLSLIQVNQIVPASQYGHLVPPGLEHDLISYWHTYDFLHPTVASIAKATNSPAGKVMAATSAKLVKFNPPKLLGDGPYELVNASLGGILYKKWMGWWDARAIRAPWVQISPMDSATEYGGILYGRIDQELNSQFTDPQAAKLNESGVGHYGFLPTAVQQESLAFHLADYPFNLLAVRRALAYAINRRKLAKLDMSGKIMQNPPIPYPDGINDYLGKQYITPAQFKTMHAYAYDPAKAQALLRSAGFVKHKGIWYTPKNKPFKFTIFEPSGYTQFDEDGIIIANDLKKIGIQAKTQDVESTSYFANQVAGAYPVTENFMDWGFGSPMADFAATFNSDWNYTASYNGGPCKCAIGIGPVSNVPGLGKVNIARELNREVATAPPNTWRRYTYDWARWINDELPILPLYNNAFHMIWSTSRYTDFPSGPAIVGGGGHPRSTAESQGWMWTNLGGAAEEIVWMQEGYLRLKTNQ